MVKKNNQKPSLESAGIITLEWLTYVFWGLASLALNILVSLVVSYYVVEQGITASEPVAYAVAASLILLPIAFVTDVIFSKREDALKSSASSIARIVFSILYALVALGGLVSLVFIGINTLLNGFMGDEVWVAVATSFTIFLAYLLLLARVAKPHLLGSMRYIYRLLVTSVIIIVCILAINGPVANAFKTRQDRSIRSSMELIVNSIRDNVNSGKSLPSNINEAVSSVPQYMYSKSQSENTIDFASRGLITYEPNSRQVTTSGNATTYYYQICGVFEYETVSGTGSTTPVQTTSTSGYSSYLDFGSIKKGKNCYGISADYYLAK